MLVEAALAINEAPTLDDAFGVLAHTAASLLGADTVRIISWDGPGGVVVAGWGQGVALDSLVEATPVWREWLDGGEPQAGPPILDGWDVAQVSTVAEVRSAVRVQLSKERGRATFHAGWRDELDSADLREALDLMQTLTHLTTLAERAQLEGDRSQLDTLLQDVADGVVLTHGERLIANRSARAILGVPEGKDFTSAMFKPRTLDGAPFELTAGLMPGQHALALNPAGSLFRIRATALDGRELVLDGSVSPTANGAAIVFRDMTEEHELGSLTAQTLAAVFDALPTALLCVDAETDEVQSANPALCTLVGLSAEQIVGTRPPCSWCGDDPELLPADHELARRVWRTPDGRPLPVEILTRDVTAEDGRVISRVALITDLTERRRLEQQLVQSGKLAAIGELAAGVAHEINNPLFAILGLTEFLIKETEPGTRAAQRLELIQRTGLEIKEIVRALLDFARENPDEQHLVALEDVVHQTTELVRRTNAHKGVELYDRCHTATGLVRGSPNQLKQIFLNLIGNARQAMPNGGTITVDVRREGDHVLATVTDDGPGIEPEVAARIFEPFFTTKRQAGGTGLGLSVSLGIAESHGGSLTLHSEPGHGAAFTLRLPIEAEELS